MRNMMNGRMRNMMNGTTNNIGKRLMRHMIE
jgi:hypothetical protein